MSDLEKLRKEYQEYAYIISHDLSAPLRHINEFSVMLLESLEDKLGEDERLYADFLQKAVKKINDMQEALLKYSRLNTQTQEPQIINLNEILEEVLSSLGPIIQQKNATVLIDDLPHVMMDSAQAKFLFQEILKNALQYNDGDDVRVHVGVGQKDEDSTDRQWFFVRDNGIGIEEKFNDAVFKMFRRLHAEGDYADNIFGKVQGVGLTFAKKIIQQHGGQVLLQKPAQDLIDYKGVELKFSLPCA